MLALLENFLVIFIFCEPSDFLYLSSPLVEIRHGLAHVLIEPCQKLLVEFLGGHAQILSDDVRRLLAVAVGVHDVQQLVRPPAFLDVIADAARLIVGHRHLIRIFRTNKSTVKLRDGQKFFVLYGN